MRPTIAGSTPAPAATVGRISGGKYTLDLPSDHGQVVEDKQPFESVINQKIIELYKGKDDYLAILSTEDQVKKTKPDFRVLANIDSRGLIISSRGSHVDFVSRGPYFQLEPAIQWCPLATAT